MPILCWKLARIFRRETQCEKRICVPIFANLSRIFPKLDQVVPTARGIDVLQQPGELIAGDRFLIAFERLPARFGGKWTDVCPCHHTNGDNCRGKYHDNAAKRKTDHLDFAFINTMIGEC